MIIPNRPENMEMKGWGWLRKQLAVNAMTGVYTEDVVVKSSKEVSGRGEVKSAFYWIGKFRHFRHFRHFRQGLLSGEILFIH